MDRYLIETPHTASECLALIKLLNAQGYLWNFDWDAKLASTANGPSLKLERRYQSIEFLGRKTVVYGFEGSLGPLDAATTAARRADYSQTRSREQSRYSVRVTER